MMEKDKDVCICKVGEKGQIVIPVNVMNKLGIKSGDSVVFLCDEKKGMAIVKSDIIENLADDILSKGDNEGGASK